MIITDKILTNFTANSTSFSGSVFNAKEKDYESGFHYYGSRSYSSELSIWNSTDPMADKYPSLTPYNYCANNPVKLIDPNGEDIWIVYKDGNNEKLFNYTKRGTYQSIPQNDFLNQTIDALDKASEHSTTKKNILDFFNDSQKNAMIFESNEETEYKNNYYENHDSKADRYFGGISFDKNMAISDGKRIIPPFILLIHELGHLKSDIEDHTAFLDRSNTHNYMWLDHEEKYNIQKYEHPLINYFNNLTPISKDKLLKRENYNLHNMYNKIRVKSSTSMKIQGR